MRLFFGSLRSQIIKKDSNCLLLVLAIFAIIMVPRIVSPATGTDTTTFALDGTAQAQCSNITISCSATLSTQHANDVIIVFTTEALNISPPCSVNVSDSAGLSWSSRSSVAFDPTGRGQLQEFYTKSASMLTSDSVTESVGNCGNAYNGLMVVSVSGANFTSPFDPNAGLPSISSGTSAGTAVSVSTSDTNDFIIAGVVHGGISGSLTPESGFSLAFPPSAEYAVEYTTVSTILENSLVTFGDSWVDNWMSIGDALQGTPPLPSAMSLTPTAGVVGTQVVVQGSDFPVSSSLSEVLMTFDDQFVGFAFTSNGSFNFTFNVPVSQPGPHLVKATEPSVTSRGLMTVAAQFQVVGNPLPPSVNLTVGTVYFP